MKNKHSNGTIVLFTGGIKSGKSSAALSFAEKHVSEKGKNFFLATALPLDPELKKRIQKHKKQRKKFWKTIEEPEKIDSVFRSLPSGSTILVDCLTLWLANLMSKKRTYTKAKTILTKSISLIRRKNISAIFVTNEVGWGIIPENRLSRNFADSLGKLNQILAKSADKVYLMAAGNAIKIKGGSDEIK